MSKLNVGMLAEFLSWKVLTGDEDALNRIIEIPDVNRPGFELMGYFSSTVPERMVILGAKEMLYISNEMDEISQRKAFEFLTSDKTPGIVICRGFDCPDVLMEIARRKDFPIFGTNKGTTETVIKVINYLDEGLAESTLIHGELMRVYGVGVLITGQSGVGKSEIALELMKRGHQLVCDDRVDIYNIHNELIGKTSQTISGFMELRGVGIIDISRIFGVDSYAKESKVRLHINLEKYDGSTEYDRVGIEEKEYTDILGVKILKMSIPVSIGRPMATIIETAVSSFSLMENGIDSANEFEQSVLEHIEKNKGEEE